MLLHEFRRDFNLGISSEEYYKPDPSETGNCKQAVNRPDDILAHENRCYNQNELKDKSIKPVLKDPVRPVIQQVYVFNKANRTAKQNVKKQEVKIGDVSAEVKDREIALEGMSYCKNQQAEETEEQECIKYLGRFPGAVITGFPVSPVPVIKRKKRLNDPCNPEEADQSRDEQEHFPCSDLSPGKMAFCKNNADYKENGELHQLEQLEPRNIIYQFDLSQ